MTSYADSENVRVYYCFRHSKQISPSSSHQTLDVHKASNLQRNVNCTKQRTNDLSNHRHTLERKHVKNLNLRS